MKISQWFTNIILGVYDLTNIIRVVLKKCPGSSKLDNESEWVYVFGSPSKRIYSWLKCSTRLQGLMKVEHFYQECFALLWWTSKDICPFTLIIKLGRARMFFNITLIVFLWKKNVMYMDDFRVSKSWDNFHFWTIPLANKIG